MTIERDYKVILSPHVSEKTVNLADGTKKQVAFKVAVDATKYEVKRAVEALFEVKVDKVSVIKMKPKTKRFGQIEGRTKSWKKAYVCLKEGFDIDFASSAN